MYRLEITPAVNGWIIEVTFEGRVSIRNVFDTPKKVADFLEKELPIMRKGFNETLKSWIKKNNVSGGV